MSKHLIPRDLLASSLFQFPMSRFPSLWEDLEGEMENWGWDQSGLTVSENDKNVFVEAQMPGLKAEDIHVTIENGLLRIQGEREESEEDKEKKFHRRASYSFNYRLNLPGKINEDNPQATYKDGVMKVSFDKRPERSGKRINVKGE